MAVVVFLRGINLGTRRITNDELVSVFTAAGFDDVSAYQASGNVIVGSVDTVDATEISSTLATTLGYDVDVFVRTRDELRTIAAISPVSGRRGSGGGKPQIVFLATDVSADVRSVFPDDHEVHQIGTELHWLPPAGLAELGHLQKDMDATFGTTTIRTLGTIERLVARLH